VMRQVYYIVVFFHLRLVVELRSSLLTLGKADASIALLSLKRSLSG